MKTIDTIPVAVVPWGARFEDEIGALAGWEPGTLVSARRFEAIERELEQRRLDEREERIEARYVASMRAAMTDAAMRGLPWSPTEPWAVWPDMATRMAEADAYEAMQDAAAERRDLIDAGLLHLLPPDTTLPWDQPPAATRSAAPTPGTPPPGSGSASRTALRAKIHAFLARTARSK